MSLRARLVFVLFASLGAAAAAEGCFSPTQITVTLTTDVPCGEHVETAVFVGQDAVSAETADGARASETRCVGGNIGTVALVPSGARDANVALRVVTAIRGERADVCAKAPADRVPAGCIVARRRLGFVRNAPLSLPVVMRATCAGVACPTDQTCVAGACRFSQLRPGDCERPDGCAEDTLPPSGGAIADAGPDGSADADAPTDAGSDAPAVDASCTSCDVTQIAAAETHACALRANGTVWCWGGGLLAEQGLLGAIDVFRPVGPVPVKNVNSAQQLACGGRVCGVITAAGNALGWGDDTFGQITNVPSAGQIRAATALPPMPFSKLAFGAEHTLGIADVDKVHCFASNALGQCNNNSDGGTGPHNPADMLASGVTAISAGSDHSCVIQLQRARCWGHNDQGQTGAPPNQTTVPNSPFPQLPPLAAGVRAGQKRTCAWAQGTGNAFCWGFGERGGDPGGGGPEIPIQVEGSANTTEIALMASTTCVLDTAGDVRCFGVGGGGQLGDGTLPLSERTRLAGRVLLPGRALRITAGTAFACAIVENQGVYCWGLNDAGQLGTGVTDALQHPNPIRVDLPPP